MQAIADQLVVHSGAPGAILGVARGSEYWLGAAGSEDLEGTVAMTPDRIFRAGSISKMAVGVSVMRAVERGDLRLGDRLDRYVPGFHNADEITVAMLLSHTAGVTTQWFDEPEVQAKLTADLERTWTPAEVITTMASFPATGKPGVAGMQYSNTGFVLLGEMLEGATGRDLATLLSEDVFDPLGLVDSTVQSENPLGLLAGYYELSGNVLNMAKFPSTAILSFAGAAGALHSTALDLLTFSQALFVEGRLLRPASIEQMLAEPQPGAGYGHALMRLCPCEGDGPMRYSGYGHGGHLPGYWSMLVHYPALGLSVIALINRDVIDGVALQREVFDETLKAVVEAVQL